MISSDADIRKCKGLKAKLKPCQHINDCDLCICYSLQESQDYCIGIGKNAFKCKRDNPNYKPLTKQQFIEFYKQMPSRTNISLGELFEYAKITGMLEK